MLHVQKYLRDGGSLEDLATLLGITAKRHNAHHNLVLLKYNQIESPMGDPIVQECRGIILDENNNWDVVFHGMDKFFNYGEGHATAIDWKTAWVQEKLDGSLIGMYLYNGVWETCSSGTPDASGEVNTSGKTFREYFNETLNGRFNHNKAGVNDFNYWLELTGPTNRVVVVHTTSEVTLLGARNIHTGKEVHPSEVNHFFPGVSLPREFPIRSMQDIIESFKNISPLSQEGYVISWFNKDGDLERNKSKHPGYVALHHAKDGMTTKAFVEIARTGEVSEAIAAFPEFKPLLDDAKSRYDKLLATIEADYAKYKNIPAQKDFALAVKDSRCSAACFQLRAGKVRTIREFLAKCHIDTMMRLLGY